jgi:Guanine nucleotide exchange factor synembryn
MKTVSEISHASLGLCSRKFLEFAAAKLTAQIGYGNAAGFLFNKGMMAPPGEAHDANGVLLNPITGTNVQPRPADVEMSEEEKEREAERLFVLFDRLERSGMGVNPVRKAQQEGKFENLR